MHMVRAFEEAGAGAVHIEDQMPAQEVRPPQRQEAGRGARHGGARSRPPPRRARDLYVIARTDAAASEGIDGAVARAKLYVEAGADAIFPEALNTAEMFRDFRRRMPGVKLLANMTEFGSTPFFTAAEFEAMGYRMVIWPVSSLRVANKAQERLYATLRRDGGTHGHARPRCRPGPSSTPPSASQDYEALDASIVQTVLPRRTAATRSTRAADALLSTNEQEQIHVDPRQHTWLPPHRRAPAIEDGAGELLVRQDDGKRRCWKARRPCVRRPGSDRSGPASTTSRATISRSTTRCSTPASWSAPSPPIYGWKGGAVSLDTYFAMARGSHGKDDGACARPRATIMGRGARLAGAGNDQVVRHQLPLHGARVRRGQTFSLGCDQAGRRVPRGEGAGRPYAPGAGGAGHLPAAGQEHGPVAASAVAADEPAAGLCRGPAHAGEGRRRLGADRRAGAGPRPDRRCDARGARRRLRDLCPRDVPA